MRRGLEGVFKSAQGTEWFSIPVFFVLLRETLEVMVILACMFCALQKLNLTSLKKWITYGAIAGLVVDVIIGVALIAVFLTLKNNAFDSASDSEKVFESSLMLVSSLIVTVFALGLTKFISGLEGKFGAKLAKYTAEIEAAQLLIDGKEKDDIDSATSTDVVVLDSTQRAVDINLETTEEGNVGDLVDSEEAEKERKETHAVLRSLKFNLFVMSFMAIVREGLECIVFLAGLTSSYSGESMIFPSISGVLIGCLLGYLFIRTSQQFAMLYFVLISMLMLFMIGGGLLTRAFTEFVELGLEGGPKVFNARSCCNQNIPFWGFMRIIFGYNDNPSTVEFCVYFGYWVCVLLLSWYKGLFTLISASLMDYQIVLSNKYIALTRSTKNKDEKESLTTEESSPRVELSNL